MKSVVFVSGALLALVACRDGSRSTEGAATTRTVEGKQQPRLDIRAEPQDAVRLPSGIAYKQTAWGHGPRATANDVVALKYSGWRQANGAAFFSSTTPIQIDLAHAAPAFVEVVPRMRAGDRILAWIPSSPGTSEALVYEMELVSVGATKTESTAP